MAGYIGARASVVSSGAERKKTYAITTTTTSLTGLAYTPTKVHVYHNGIRLVDGTDYTATDGSSITLTTAAENGDEVVVISYATFQTSDTVSAANGGTFAGNVEHTGTLTASGDLNAGTIKDATGTNTAITISSGGEVSVNNHFIGLYKNGNQTLTDASFTKLTSWNVAANNGLTWDAANNRIEVAVAGAYLINLQVQGYSDSNAAVDFRMQIQKNGSQLFGTYSMIVGGGNSADPYDLRHFTDSIQNIVPLQAGDYIDAHVYLDVTAGSPVVFDGDSSGERACSLNMLRLGD